MGSLRFSMKALPGRFHYGFIDVKLFIFQFTNNLREYCDLNAVQLVLCFVRLLVAGFLTATRIMQLVQLTLPTKHCLVVLLFVW